MGIYRGPGGTGDAVNDASSEAILTVEARDAAIAAKNAAEAAQVAAETAETHAETAETNAETAATNASNSASSASTSATNAASSASDAANSEANALTYSDDALSDANAASASASAAAASATNAADSATTASTQATNASTSATSAATSATNASNSASAAATSATNAASSATAASGSATSASSSASSASTSASNAATSETNAASSASTATTQAGIATTKASEAATSATNASNSASAASTSASNAATSETNAASSATAAAASYDSFDDRYLGAKSTAPTVDNDGNSLLIGALYFNTVSNFMKVWDGSNWLDAYASLSGALLAANNLSDLVSASTARTNLGVAIGTNVQAWDADLDTWATKTAPSGTVVGTSDSQTLTNKTLALGSNTVSGTLAQFNTAVTDADLVSLAGTETLTNKTLTSPVISGGSINNTPIGASTASTGAFTTLAYSGTLTGDTGVVNLGSGQFYKDASGNVGIGTSSPTRVLQIVSAAPTAGDIGIQITDSVASASLQLMRTGATYNYAGMGANQAAIYTYNNNMTMCVDGTGAFTVATNGSERMRIDSSGNVLIAATSAVGSRNELRLGGNNAGSAITMGRAGTNKFLIQLDSGDNVSFENTANTPMVFTTNNTERMRIDSSGNVGIGTSSPAQKLDVVGGSVGVTASGTLFNLLNLKDSVDQSGATFIQFANSAGGNIGNINRVGTTNAVIYNTTSDQRLKSNIKDASPVLDKLMNVKVRQFDWTIGELHQDAGFIAQELAPVLSGIVSEGKTEEDYWQLDYSRLTPYLVKAIQEQQALITNLTTRLTALENK